MSTKTPLTGLKAAAKATSTTLRGILVPRFWGSYERRWELAKLHLVPVQSVDIYHADRALCGHAVGCTGEDYLPGMDSEPLTALPTGRGVCKKCCQVARKRGLL